MIPLQLKGLFTVTKPSIKAMNDTEKGKISSPSSKTMRSLQANGTIVKECP
jgi:hypothetical protein